MDGWVEDRVCSITYILRSEGKRLFDVLHHTFFSIIFPSNQKHTYVGFMKQVFLGQGIMKAYFVGFFSLWPKGRNALVWVDVHNKNVDCFSSHELWFMGRCTEKRMLEFWSHLFMCFVLYVGRDWKYETQGGPCGRWV